MTRKQIKALVCFTVFSITVVMGVYVYAQLMVPLPAIGEMFEVEVKKGSSLRHAVRTLGEQGLIRDRAVFTAIGRFSGLDRKLIPGFYQFYGKLSPWDVYKKLIEGHVVHWQVTIVEGDSLFEIKDTLLSEGIMPEEDFDGLVKSDTFLSAMGINAPSVEGYLFPDTYNISKGMTPEEVFSMMVRRLRAVFDEELHARAAVMGMTENEVLTLASIVEKEAILNRERPIIAGVYHNRLRIGMPLQADPTAIYGVKPFNKGVKRRDLRRRSEYNTYFIKGLPPGPISSPGLKSIRAALYPADVPYLFFVANHQGGHSFSRTLKEHLEATEEYLRMKYETAETETEVVQTQ